MNVLVSKQMVFEEFQTNLKKRGLHVRHCVSTLPTTNGLDW